MRLLNALLCLLPFSSEAQEGSWWRPLGREEPNTIRGELMTGVIPGKDSKRSAMVSSTDQIFPHIATGDGWETVIVMVNMSLVPIEFTQRFFTTAGQPMRVTFKNYPELQVIEDTAIVGRLPPGSSFNFALFDSGKPLQTGWGTLTYDTSIGRLGAYAIFRQRVPGRPTFEALVPLSAYDDTFFFMPFDNIQGFVTAMALANPASNLSNQITVICSDLSGREITRGTITLPPSGQLSFVLTERFPQLADRLGTLMVSSNLTRLAAMGIRFNSREGYVFSSIPIMNWSGMFQ